MISEASIQRDFVKHYKTRSEVVIPNVNVFGWESDILLITGSGRIHEFEIKLCKHDLTRDNHKAWKKEKLRNARNTPHFFWYICAFDYSIEDLPYEGYIAYDTAKKFDVNRSAKELHQDPISATMLLKLLNRWGNQYWRKYEKELSKLARRNTFVELPISSETRESNIG